MKRNILSATISLVVASWSGLLYSATYTGTQNLKDIVVSSGDKFESENVSSIRVTGSSSTETIDLMGQEGISVSVDLNDSFGTGAIYGAYFDRVSSNKVIDLGNGSEIKISDSSGKPIVVTGIYLAENN